LGPILHKTQHYIEDIITQNTTLHSRQHYTEDTST